MTSTIAIMLKQPQNNMNHLKKLFKSSKINETTTKQLEPSRKIIKNVKN
jgi:hypothetical protein